MRNKRYSCYKIFTVGQHVKEETWLNSMSAKGMRLVRVNGLRYEFEQCKPGEYQYRLEFLEELPSHPESVAYLTFLEDYGIEMVDSTLRWVYLEKKTESGEPFELFSDSLSLYKHYQRIFRFTLLFTFLNILFFIQFMHLQQFTFLGLISLSFVIFASTTWKMYRKMRKLKRDKELFDQ